MERQVRQSQFGQLINEMHRGRVATKIDELLMEVGQKVEELGISGSVTVKLSFSKTQAGEHAITAHVSSKVPQPKAQPAIRFWNEDRQSYELDHPDQKLLVMEPVSPSESPTQQPG